MIIWLVLSGKWDVLYPPYRWYFTSAVLAALEIYAEATALALLPPLLTR